MSIVRWDDEQVIRRALEAARGGIDETTGAAVLTAYGEANVDTSYMRDHIDNRAAEVRGDTVSGSFGVYNHDPEYAAAQEYLPPPRGKAFLRPAADQEFPKLASRIAERFR